MVDQVNLTRADMSDGSALLRASFADVVISDAIPTERIKNCANGRAV